MAITRTQIARQLYRFGGDTMGGPNDKSVGGPGPDDRGSREQNINQKNVVREARVRAVEDLIDRPLLGFTDAAKYNIAPLGLKALQGLFNSGTTKPFITPDRGGSSQMDSSTPLWAQLGFNNEEEYLTSLQAQETMDQESEVEEPFEVSRRFRADGGRIGFRGGAAAASDAAAGRDAGRDTSAAGTSDRGDGPATGGGPTTGGGPSTNVGGGDKPKFDIFNPIDSMKAIQRFKLGLKPEDIAIAKSIEEENENDPENVSLGTGLAEEAKQNIIKNKEEKQSGLSEAEQALREQGLLAIGGRVGLMEGGMPYEGGIMDLESARQMYGLGKLVKKVTRGVKKIAKSPIGKAALLYTVGGGLGSMAGGQSFFSNFANPMNQITGMGSIFSKSGLQNIASKVGLGAFENVGSNRIFQKNVLGKALTSPGGIIAATSLLPLLGLGTGEESEEEAQAILDNSGIDIEALRANPQLARRFAAEGGSMDEPVAKKTMPLLDMDGKEMDLRAEGGFVPIGRMEKADDVPARLSKNEFVFTADAVRNAGDGDVDKGAEVMYNMMKNLESGGDVSEESQGLEGARKMFQTSQRLEEVL